MTSSFDGEPTATVAKLRSFFESAHDGVLIVNDELTILEANPAACALTGRAAGWLVGRDVIELVAIADGVDLNETRQQLLSEVRGEITLNRPDGGYRIVECTVVADFLPGQHLSVLRDVTDQKEVAAQLRDANRKLQRRNQELAALADIGLRLNTTIELNQVYKRVYEEVATGLLHADHMSIALFDPTQNAFVCHYLVVDGEVVDPGIAPAMPIGDGPTSDTFRTRKPRVVHLAEMRASLSPDRVVQIGDRRKPMSALYLPLNREQDVIGVLSVQSYAIDAFADHDLALLSIAVNQAAAAIANARLHEQLRMESRERARVEQELESAVWNLNERVKELSLVNQVSRELQRTDISDDEILEKIVRLIPQGWQHSHSTTARLTLEGISYVTDGFREGTRQHSAPLYMRDRRQGRLEVHLDPASAELDAQAEDPFLNEERDLLKTVAELVQTFLDQRAAQAALQSNQSLLQNVLETLPVGVWIATRNMEIIDCNPAALQIWAENASRARTSFHRHKAWRTSTGEMVQGTEWAAQRALREDVAILNEELEIESLDGKRKVILNSAVPIRNEAHESIGVIIVNQDITERKARERQLTAIARLAIALRTATDLNSVYPIALASIEKITGATGVGCLLANSAGDYELVYGIGDLAQVTGRTIERGEHLCAQAFATGRSQIVTDLNELAALRPAELSFATRVVLTVPLGAELQASSALIVGYGRDADASDVRMVEALAEIVAGAVQRSLLYEEIQAQALQLQRVLDAADFGIVLLDEQKRLVLGNEQGLAKMWLLAHAAVGDRVTSLAGKEIEHFYAAETGSAVTQEIVVTDPTPRTFSIRIVPVQPEREIEGLVVVAHDVTKDKELQERIRQHENLAAIGGLAAGIAHDFNNIIAVIALNAQMMEMGDGLSRADHERARVIREQSQRATDLVKQIMDFGRQSVVELRPLDLADVAEDTLRLWRRTLPENIVCRLDYNARLSYRTRADPSHLQQVFTNLAVNARDAMPTGGALTLTLTPLESADEHTALLPELAGRAWIMVSVEDTGCGISPEDIPHIFEPFYTTKEIGRGAGLGLAQVYGVIRQHGGHLHVESESGKGTNISIYLPDAGRVESGSVHHFDDEASIDNEFILLVEDNPAAREATVAILELFGYHVLAASSGAEAIQLFRSEQNPIHLVLCDLVMPEMGGLELFHALQNEAPGIRFLMMTGTPLEDSGYELLQNGNVGWIEKPFSIQQLMDGVRAAISAKG